jgi:hypothetical protein
VAATGLTEAAIRTAVVGAVAAVLGEEVGPEVPLVGAGLDSLGEHAFFLFTCCSPG